MVRLKHLASLRAECSSNGERPYVALEHIRSWTGALVGGSELPVRNPAPTGMASVEPGDVLFGKLRPYLAKTWLVDRPALASTELMCIRPRIGVDSRWLAYSTMATPFVEWADATSEGTKMPRTSWEKVGEYDLWVPFLSEQRAIADYLDIETGRLDWLLSKKRRMIQLLEEYDICLLDEFLGQLSTNKFARLGYLADVRTGVTLNSMRAGTPKDVTVPYLRVANVQHDHIDLNDVRELTIDQATAHRTSLRKGDVLMTEGGDIDKLGRGTVWEGQIDPCLHQNHVFAVRTQTDQLIPEFLALVTRSSYARWYFEMTGVRSTNLASTNSSKVASFRVPLPSRNAQVEMTRSYQKRRRAWQRTRRAISRQLHLLELRRRALITAAVTGEWPVPGVAA